MITYRRISEPSDLKDLEIVAEEVWGVGQGIPDNLMRAFAVHGGLIVGAYDGDYPIGVAAAFIAFHPQTLWSHMAGVRPEYQGRGVGSGLKFAQRTWALDNGFDEIHWTFDPLQRGNINFNLNLLGATAHEYHVNFYGTMGDKITGDLPSDRIVGEWKLRDPLVEALASGHDPRPTPPPPTSETLLLCADADGMPIVSRAIEINTSAPNRLYAQLPQSLTTLRETHPEAALAWRLAQREVLLAAFKQGYTAVHNLNLEQNALIVLERR